MPLLQDFRGPIMTPTELERLDNIKTFTLNNAHYFCETADVTRAFPSRHAPDDPSWEFVWNRWLASPLREAGLAQHCPQLLQVPFPAVDELQIISVRNYRTRTRRLTGQLVTEER